MNRVARSGVGESAQHGGQPRLRDWLRLAAKRVPDTRAIQGPDAALSYAELQDAVQRLSQQILLAGLVPGDRVALSASRSVDSIVDILACVDAGVAYVPVDLSYPVERLRTMMQAAQPRLVLGQHSALASLEQAVGPVPTLDRPSTRQAPLYGDAADLAYVLFTSGSTGQPKGVAMGAGPLESLIAWHASHHRLGQAARTLQFAPLSFDVHFQEIFSTIACGGTLVVLEEAQRRDPALLHAALMDLRIERIFAPYVALQMLAEASRAVAPVALRDVISAGEQLQVTPAIRSLFQRLPGAELHNQYGPTETHVVTAHELRGDPQQWPDIPAIGLPLPHVTVALRQAGGKGLAQGDTGELLLGGAALAHGYLDQPSLSAERFVDDVPGLPGRWYTSGDLVQRNPDGSFTFLGRADQQVKVDGFRIEPGEIELALMQHTLVKEAVVTAPDLPGVGKQLVAYLVLRDANADQAAVFSTLRSWLRQQLPEYMVPVRYERLSQLPTTSSGKIDRKGLPMPQVQALHISAQDPAQALRLLWQELLGVAQIGDEQNLFDLGARSLLVLRFISRMRELGITGLTVADVYDRPTLGGLAAVLKGVAHTTRRAHSKRSEIGGMAIVGMATRTAGADGIEAFWANLLAEKEGIRHYSANELDPSVPEAIRSRPNFVAARGALDDVARFDAALFGISAREATVLDPQQRLMLELSWAALEHAAIDPSQTTDRVGVFAGTGNNSYAPALRQQAPELVAQYGEFATMLASEKDYVATRVANRLNLNGPALSIHTACSTGLVAVTQAWHALASGQCDIALAGGTSVVVPQEGGYLHVEGGMESADGHCRPFDADASGTVFASGGGVVVLKRLEDAQRDGDTIYGVIRGVGINNDGGDKASFTAPSVTGQAGAIRMALDHAQINARSIGYVEAHGTGTALGDPIEVAALTRAWREDTPDQQYCGLGSVKSNLGHMVAAAGVVGLVKATLALHRELIPATLHFRQPNPQIDFSNTPFHVVSQATPWKRGDAPRYAAVSSFGVGGTNAHVIVQEAPQAQLRPPSDKFWVLPLSGVNSTATLRRAEDLAQCLDVQPTLDLAAVAATLMRGRKALAYRAAVVARTPAEAVTELRALKSAGLALKRPRVVFVFPGQGSQHPGMAKGLAQDLPAFGQALNECLAIANPLLGVALEDWLVHADPADADVAARLAQTQYAQPALFGMCYALATWLNSVGVHPSAMIGHSIGEYAAACVAGVFSLQDAVRAVVARGQAMAAQPRGAMLAVRSPAEALLQALKPGIEIAGYNAPNLTVVAGDAALLESFATDLEAHDVECTRLKVSHAFHSASMEGALPPITEHLEKTVLNAPTLPLYSCVTGALLTADQATSPDYWARQVRAPVQFSQAVQAELALDGDVVFVEVGPSQALSALVRQHRTSRGVVPRVVPMLGAANKPSDATHLALAGLGALWSAGCSVRWPVDAAAARAALPTYPFGGERYWFKPAAAAAAAAATDLNFSGGKVLGQTPAVPGETATPPTTSVALPLDRLPRLQMQVAQILSDVSGLPIEEITPEATLVDQGFDSLSLTQATLELERVFGLKLRFRRLLEDLNSVGKLAQFLDDELSSDQWPPTQAAGSKALDAAQETSSRALIDQPFGAAARITLAAQPEFTPAQKNWLDQLVLRYNAKTSQSKAFSQTHRKAMADPRVVTGFNPLWKDLVYPIVVNKSQGAKLWDLDGNEYIDLLSCFGANLLGYQHPELVTAMVDQLHAGIEVGPQHPLSADVAHLICEFTGMERVGFCNTGSEAVMGAMRIARTVTGRKTIAIFSNSYHGIFDEVIVRGSKQLRSLSAAPGILANTVENILVLDWNSEESLRVLRERGPELAAIMTEPIQNKYPTIQPREFMHALRRIASDSGCALIFDEVVTGFRVAPGGAQEFYGVRADICTYGKTIGGGLPFAAIAGASSWMDALDGGHWQYGDDSYPEAGVTYFAGTFVRHPLALAAAKATLVHLQRSGPGLYQTLNTRTQSMVDRLNAVFSTRRAPVQAVHCASIWRLAWDDGQKYVSLFYYLLRFHGLHVYEQFGHFVTEAMGEAETQRIVDVFTLAVDELLALGLIVARPSVSEAPLTPGQTERWLAAGFDSAARRALNESFCVSLVGAVDLGALRQAVHDVMARHEAFRVKFDEVEPRQFLVPVAPITVADVDLRAEPDAVDALDRFCKQAGGCDFPLGQAPLAAASLVRLADGRVVVHLVASHLVFDGWASSVFNAELALAYQARLAGHAATLPSAESPLVFATLEQARMEGAQGQVSLAFWTSVLRDPPPKLKLGDRTPPATRLYAADTVRATLDGAALSTLRAAARHTGATLFQFLLAAVTLMVRQRSKQAEFVISIPYASQGLDRHGPLMADGVLDLPLRLRCEPGEAATTVLARVRAHLMDALEHPVVTQGTIARALGIRGGGDSAPFASVFFNLNPRVDLSGFAPLAAHMHEGRKYAALSELFFNFYEKEHALTLDLHYSTEYHSPANAQALVDDLLRVCEEICQEIQVPAPALTAPPLVAAALQLPSPSPVDLVDPRLLNWNRTDHPLPPGCRAEQWVSQQAAATPDAAAVTCGTTTLSYRQLESRANRLAQVLVGMGVGPGELVGLCLERGPDLLPALLAVLKCGAGYVPLDPGFPSERLQYMAQDAELALVITDTVHAHLAGLPRTRQLRVDEDAWRMAAASDAPVVPQTGWPDDASAYVIYTSGSTGKPKGVVVGQRALCNFLASMRRTPGLKPSDRLLAVTTLSFDIAVLELLLPLTVGAQVVLAQREEAMDGEVLGRMLHHHSITVMQATPTTWHVLLDAAWRAPQGLRAFCGGEPLPGALAARLLEQGVELWNMYGPTETTVWSTVVQITQQDVNKISIGRPIHNTQVWVLDDSLRPVPVGSEGEICIGGLGVAQGYFKRPELTADRLVVDPFSASPGARLYRTGDLGRWREDGTLEHLGRLDFQVKIRGYRIELGEIEAHLAALPGVARTVVVAREDTPGDVRLVGYAVAHSGVTLDAAALREALRPGLPDYMLPQYIVPLQTMPLLPNGKIDRKALPSPQGAAPVSAVTTQVVQSDREQWVATQMQEVLKVPVASRHDDFFALGGHSLLGARLVGQINRSLGLQVGLRILFESPTVAQLAQAIDRELLAALPARPPIVHRAEQHNAPMTLMQERMHFIEQLLGGGVAYNAPSCHRLTGPMNLQAFDKAFQQMVHRQPSLRTRFVRGEGGIYVQEVQANVSASLLPVVDLSLLPLLQRERVLREHIDALAAEVFDLEQGPLFNAKLFKLGAQEHALYFCCHHIVWDGWSFDILYSEMSALYEAYAQDVEPTLAAPTVTYGDFAQWHQNWLQTDEIQSQLAFWTRHLGGLPPARAPVTDMPRQKSGLGRGASQIMHLSNARVDPWRDMARRTGSTLSIVALSVYSAVVSQWLGEPAPAIGLPVRGRPSPELEGVMGFFNNMLLMRLRVDPSLRALDWIAEVRRTVTEAFAHQDVPFEVLAQQTPGLLYQAMFSFQDARARQTHWGTLAHERIPVMHHGATEDLNLWMVEIPSGIEAGLQYNADAFLPSTAQAISERFLLAFDRLVAQPEQTLADLLRPAATEVQQLASWAQPVLGPSAEDDVVDQIHRHSLREPQAIAWRFGEHVFTRSQIQQAVQVAQALIKPCLLSGGDVIAMVTNNPLVRSVATLAVLASGARVLSLQTPISASDQAALGARTDLAAVLALPSDALDLPGTVLRVDLSGLLGNEAMQGLGTRLGMSPNAEYVQPRIPLDRALLSSLLVNSRPLVPLMEGDAVLGVEGAGSVHLLAWTLLAWAQGAVWLCAHETDGATSSPLHALVQREKPRLLHAPWRTVVQLSHSVHMAPWPMMAWVDADQISTAQPNLGLPDSPVRALHLVAGLYLDAVGLPVAAHRVDEDVLSAVLGGVFHGVVLGRALLPGQVSVVDALGRVVPVGVAGRLQWQYPGANAADGDTLWRWRSDGVLQRVSELPQGDADHMGPAPQRTAMVEPTSDAEAALCDIWRTLFARADIGVADDFFRLGGHSMLAMRMMAMIAQRMGRQLPFSVLISAPTIAQLAQRLASQEQTESLVLIRPGNSAKHPLFLVHDGDGETLLYRNLAMRLGAERAVYGLQPLGGGGLALQHTRIADMARHYVDCIRTVQPHGPYMVGGLCAGGVIAFEVANQLQAMGEPVAFTAVMDIGDVKAPVRRALVARERLKRFGRIFHKDADVPLGEHVLHILSMGTRKARNYLSYAQTTRAEDAAVNVLARKLQSSLDQGESPPADVQALTVRQLYYFARSHYAPNGMMPGDIVLFRATRGDGTQGDTPGVEMYADDQFGWAKRTTGRVYVFDIPGGHSTMLQEPNVEVLATALQAQMDRVEA